MVCQRCQRDVLTFDPHGMTNPEAAAIVGQGWAEHAADCPLTCDHCGRVKGSRNPTCGDRMCKRAERLRVVGDRVADIQILLVRTSDAEWIAHQVGLSDAKRLRHWLRRNGRADLVQGDGPLAPDRGVAA